ncbi:MAG: hypothetical protein FWG14_02230 [Peptococcaceae bacterium]|nr:hypothetical protein [Peptococcaceae bacterium]
MKKYVLLGGILCLLFSYTLGCSAPAADASVDVDLTVLSRTMVYAEAADMTNNPDNYIGKTVKMSGLYGSSQYDQTGRLFHYVLIEDAAACCQQGFEFVWNGEHIYPDDYPEETTQIEIVGVFQSYEVSGNTYYCLAVDNILVLNSSQ